MTENEKQRQIGWRRAAGREKKVYRHNSGEERGIKWGNLKKQEQTFEFDRHHTRHVYTKLMNWSKPLTYSAKNAFISNQWASQTQITLLVSTFCVFHYVLCQKSLVVSSCYYNTIMGIHLAWLELFF